MLGMQYIFQTYYFLSPLLLYQCVSSMCLDSGMGGRDIHMNEMQFLSSKGSEFSRKTQTHTRTLCYDKNYLCNINTRCKSIGIIETERPIIRKRQGNQPLGGNGIWKENFAGLTESSRHHLSLGDTLKHAVTERETVVFAWSHVLCFFAKMHGGPKQDVSTPLYLLCIWRTDREKQGNSDTWSAHTGMCIPREGNSQESP